MARGDAWRSCLRADPVPWLLEPANPSACYLTLRHVLGRPEDAPEVIAARAGILQTEPATSIMAAQWPDGYWIAPDRGYTPRYRATVWQIMFLAQLGAPRDARIERACEYVWQHSRQADGLFTPRKCPELSDLVSLNGNLIWALVQFGYADDPRMGEVLEALAALDLTRLFDAGHVAAVVKLCKGIQALPAGVPTSLQAFLDEAVEFVAHHLELEVRRTGLRLSFPLAEATDVLEMLTVLLPRKHTARFPHLPAVIELVISAQNGGGRWRLAAVPGKMWAPFGEPGRPNKWVTIRALRVLRAFYV